jgi:hypothetical protein
MDIEVIGTFYEKKADVNIIIFRYISIKPNFKKKYKRKKRKQKPDIKAIINTTKDMIIPLKRFLKSVNIRLSLYINFGLSSPDKTAISYGILYSLTSLLYSFSEKRFKSYNQNIDIIPDLTNEKFDYKAKIYLHTRLIYLMILGKNILTNIIKHKGEIMKKGGVIDDRTSN